jgi:hypothetical protein
MKKCNKCGNEKELTEFFFRKDSQKYRNECKVCFTESNKINGNVESMKEYNKQYIKINSEKIKEYKKQYYDNNKEKILENRKQYYNDNIEKVKKYRKENKIILSEKQKIYYQNRLKKITGKLCINSNKTSIMYTSKILPNISLYLPNILQFYK